MSEAVELCVNDETTKAPRHSCALPKSLPIRLSDEYPEWERRGQKATLLALDFDGKAWCRAWVIYQDGKLGNLSPELFTVIDSTN